MTKLDVSQPETMMTKVAFLLAVALALAAGSLSVTAVHPEQAAGEKAAVWHDSSQLLQLH
jgi:hypothetical protein